MKKINKNRSLDTENVRRKNRITVKYSLTTGAAAPSNNKLRNCKCKKKQIYRAKWIMNGANYYYLFE